MTPTIVQVLKCYKIIADVERAKTGRPGEGTKKNVLRGTVAVCNAAGVALGDSVEALTRRAIDRALADFMVRGMTRLSAWSYICTGSVVVPLTSDTTDKYCPVTAFTKLDLPAFRAQAPRYIRPSSELLAKVKNWYRLQEGEYWFAATMMLEFAMRNGDVLRLKDSNFVENENGKFLSYTPHKTELTSARRVYWPIHPEIWQKFEDYGRLAGLDVTKETFDDINRDLRNLGFHGSKAAYELRKICIDHIYQKFGAEMAVSISGDDIKTITKYYADPAQPNIGAVRVLDLI